MHCDINRSVFIKTPMLRCTDLTNDNNEVTGLILYYSALLHTSDLANTWLGLNETDGKTSDWGHMLNFKNTHNQQNHYGKDNTHTYTHSEWVYVSLVQNYLEQFAGPGLYLLILRTYECLAVINWMSSSVQCDRRRIPFKDTIHR